MKEARDVNGLIKILEILPYHKHYDIFSETIKALGGLGDSRAIEILIKNSGCPSRIVSEEAVKSLKKMNSINALNNYLDSANNSYFFNSHFLVHAIETLGNLKEVKSAKILVKFLTYNNDKVCEKAYQALKKIETSENINKTTLDKIQQAFLEIKKAERKRKLAEKKRKLEEQSKKEAELKEIEEVSGMSDQEIVSLLRSLCKAYSKNDPYYKKLEPKARKIGKLLNQRGGLSEMRRIFGRLDNMPGSRTLEMHWSGIGDWQG